ncbi:hypothetical protein [Pandoraea pulmonicola]|uniref:FlxA-like protein n=1 Tax=Pandoraea pulmonicola TaxID=93221 RepID=A0AAJ4Z9W2_PANPU|nr:hypothetical protein [Pandoraea pulmonicola]AJC21712.1 hypothetical protein RO07_16700 [Pandoraea pulmonicola]SUA89414.1 Uncharacterised protein [Pandoraea pulmonicola]
MTTIIPNKGNATSSLLDVWQAHIQRQQTERASSAAAAPTAIAGSQGEKRAAQAAGAVGASNASNVPTAAGSAAATANDGDKRPSVVDTDRVNSLRDANESARHVGQSIAGAKGDAGGGGGAGEASDGGLSPIVRQTIEKLKQMLAKVMAQLEAVRNNDTMPPEVKLQQTTVLSAQAMTIQGQIQALMDPTKTKGTRVDTTA